MTMRIGLSWNWIWNERSVGLFEEVDKGMFELS